MNATLVVLAGLSVGAYQWKLLEERADTIMPMIMKTYSFRRDLRERPMIVQQRKNLGAYEPTAIPMYYKYLRDNPVTPMNWVVVALSERIGGHSKLFLPFAMKYLAESLTQANALAFIRKHGGAAEANSVAAILLEEDFLTKDPRLVFKCLHTIGGPDVLAVIQQYALLQIARNPDGYWVENANMCRNAIELRLKAEEMGLIHTPYRYAPEPWRTK